MPVIPIYGEDPATSGSTKSVRDEGKLPFLAARWFWVSGNLTILFYRYYLAIVTSLGLFFLRLLGVV